MSSDAPQVSQRQPPWGKMSSGPKPRSKPPWGVKKRTHPPLRRGRRPFTELLDDSAIAKNGGRAPSFVPHPRGIRGCRALLGITGETVRGFVETYGGGVRAKHTLTEKIASLREECSKRGERYARALIALGDKVLEAGRAPVISDVVILKILEELFSLDELDTRCAAAFMCRANENSKLVRSREPLFTRILEGERRICSKPAFMAMLKRLLEDLKSENPAEKMWAQESCIPLGVVGEDLMERLVRSGGISGSERESLAPPPPVGGNIAKS